MKPKKPATRHIAAVLVVALLVMSLPAPALAATKSTSRHRRLKVSTSAAMDEWIDYAEGHGWKVCSKKVVRGRHNSTIKIRIRRSGPSRRLVIKIKIYQPKRGAAKQRLFYRPSGHRHYWSTTRDVLWALLR